MAIHSLCQTIAFTLDPQTVLSKLADAALQQSDADEVSVLLPTNDGKEFYVAAARGEKRTAPGRAHTIRSQHRKLGRSGTHASDPQWRSQRRPFRGSLAAS